MTDPDPNASVFLAFLINTGSFVLLLLQLSGLSMLEDFCRFFPGIALNLLNQVLGFICCRSSFRIHFRSFLNLAARISAALISRLR